MIRSNRWIGRFRIGDCSFGNLRLRRFAGPEDARCSMHAFGHHAHLCFQAATQSSPRIGQGGWFWSSCAFIREIGTIRAVTNEATHGQRYLARRRGSMEIHRFCYSRRVATGNSCRNRLIQRATAGSLQLPKQSIAHHSFSTSTQLSRLAFSDVDNKRCARDKRRIL